MKTTAERLHEIMEERGLKQIDIIELAKPLYDKYGVKLSKSDMSQYCSGKVKPSQGKLFLLAAVLDIDEAWLLGYDVGKKRKPRYSADYPAIATMLEEGDAEMQMQDESAFYKRVAAYYEGITGRIIAAYESASPDTQAAVRAILHVEEDPDGDR